MRVSRSSMMLALALILSLGSNIQTFAAEPTNAGVKSTDQSASKNKFAFKLFAATDKGTENTLLSPLSAYLALAMTYNGAAGATADGMAKCLGIPQVARANLNQSNQALLSRFNATREVQLANALFVDNSLRLKETFVSSSLKTYGAIAENLPLNAPASLVKINEWISQHTNGKIPKMLDRLEGQTKVLLVNAIYFKGEWRHKFEKKDTTSGVFFGLDGSRQPVSMMHSSDQLSYSKESNFEIVKLPYSGNKLSMCILLPEKGVKFDTFCKAMKSETFEVALGHLRPSKVNLSLPKFSLSSEFKLNDALSAMGMQLAFNPQTADFSGLSTTRAWIGKVLQKTVMDVNEEGTTAAVATVVEGLSKGMFDEPQEITLVIDRPFIVAIRDQASGHLLFLGTVVHPKLD